MIAAHGLVAAVVNVFAERAYRGGLSVATLIFAAIWAGIGLAVPLRLGVDWPLGVTVFGIAVPLVIGVIWARRYGKRAPA